MAALFALCCGPRLKLTNALPDERTALLNPDIIPEASAQFLGKTTEQQQAEQDTLRRILDQASSRFINIEESSTPLTRHLRSPYSVTSARRLSSTSTSPTQSTTLRPSTIWRPPVEDEEGSNGLSKKASTHTLKTMPTRSNPTTPRPTHDTEVEEITTATTNLSGSILSNGSTTSEFGTMGSYKTARDWDEERDELPGSEGTVRGVSTSKTATRPALNDIWGGQEGDEGADSSNSRRGSVV